MSNDQPDAPKQVPNKFVVQKLTYVSQNKENKGKPNLKLQKKHQGLEKKGNQNVNKIPH